MSNYHQISFDIKKCQITIKLFDIKKIELKNTPNLYHRSI